MLRTLFCAWASVLTVVAPTPTPELAEPPTPPPPAVVPPPPAPVEIDPANYRMVLAGDIVIGLGGASLIAMGVGLGIHSDALGQRQALTVSDNPDLDAIARQDQRIQDGALTAIVGGAAAGALFVTGITLVALGYKRERERRASLPVVTLGPRGAALSWSLRF
ncbi:hypothetical protein ENSA5_13610 [Enhygromyxa salina]|uniref:Uncharacterized protein n=1 Tax=Enhygromyxa salina TaxID=215803 RepID=A0A2S9YEX2_9BACT|nr:hypothetical protein [Enhygromyxa salina]PRQ03668.1 hypothetical protein ENSA5_13610 [Enhygromyxa salina]